MPFRNPASDLFRFPGLPALAGSRAAAGLPAVAGMLAGAWLIAVAGLLLLPCAARAQDDEFYHPELEWHSIETEHFYVHYHDGAERTARAVATIAEEIYGPVTSLYHNTPDGKVNFVIKDYDDYSNGAAYFFDNKIEIWASSLDFDLRGSHNWLRNVVTHEFTHIVELQTSLKYGRRVPAVYFQWFQYERERRPDVLYGYPNVVVSYPFSGYAVPSWFAEGVAQYNRKELRYDYWDSHRDMILRMYSLDSNMLTWNEMSVFGKTSLGNESSYNAGFAFVSYIGQRYGDEKLEEISRNLSSLGAVTIDGAIEKAVGKNGGELYNEWREYLKKDYNARIASVREQRAEGDLIARVGFGNFYPSFSPDGKSIAYASNKDADYFGLSSLYIYDRSTKKEKLLKSDVRSSFSWSPDGRKIYYARATRNNPHWSNYYDLYTYDIDRDDETRLTHGLRANSPSLSPDGTTLACVAGSDGTLNIFVMNPDGTNARQLTHYAAGEQVYNPKWSPDGKNILFDYSIKDGRDIAVVPSSGGEVSFVLATPEDERNAVYSRDGSKIYFASDKTGIFNIYQLDLATKSITQISNVLGGAFMPDADSAGNIAYAAYTSTGYKIALLERPSPVVAPALYAAAAPVSRDTSAPPAEFGEPKQFDWQSLRTYNDSTTPAYDPSGYKNIATSLTLLPLIRVDNYNPKNKGIDLVKFGLYAFSYDMLDRYGFTGGADVNLVGERDLFFSFDYRGKIPGLYQLGMEPTLALEVYNLTRKNQDSYISITDRPDLNTPVTVTYGLLEFDVALKQKILIEELGSELRYVHSRYNASVESFFFEDPLSGQPPVLIQAFDNQYFIGNSIAYSLDLNLPGLSRTQDINPTGRRMRLRYAYEFNNFNPNNEYEVQNGLLVPKYEHPRFHRLEASWREAHHLPGWSHTLSAEVRGGTIFGPPQDQFFDYYIGGLPGMRGYPFYALGGNEYAMANLTYRFPLFTHIDLRVLQFYFDKLYGAVYGDVGNVHTDGNPNGYSDPQKLKRDVGFEIRLESFSYYAFPTRIFFSGTYGFDQFSRDVTGTTSTVPVVTYGKEWDFHFGILFGFDLD